MEIKSSYILLKDIRCYAYHGVAPQENVIGNEYRINLKLKVNVTSASLTDEVADTVSYADVYEVVKAEMAIRSKLLEHVCRKIVESLFSRFTSIEEIDIILDKRNPPMGADIDSAGIEMHCKR